MRHSPTGIYSRGAEAPNPARSAKAPNLAKFERTLSKEALIEMAEMIATIMHEETSDMTAELQRQAVAIKTLSDRLDDAEQALTDPLDAFDDPKSNRFGV